MLRSIDPSAESFLAGMKRIDDRMARAQKQMSTGLRVATPSDDPGAAPIILELSGGMDSLKQMLSNLGRAKSEVDAGEAGISSAVKIMDRIRTLGAQGATDTQTADSRSAIAQEVGSLLEELGGIAATKVEGRYIFSGDNDQAAPYTIDIDAADPVGLYAGSAASTRAVQHPNGSTFSIARTAKQIFDDDTDSVFDSVNALRVALKADDTSAIQDALAQVASAGTFLNRQLAFYGSTQNKISSATEYGSALNLQHTTQLTSVRDADLTESIVELQQAQTQQQSALLARSKMPRTSLFDFLG